MIPRELALTEPTRGAAALSRRLDSETRAHHKAQQAYARIARGLGDGSSA